MNGITYYRLKSDYPGDYTKNCALNGSEVDNNFYVLEGRDVKSIAVKDKDIVVTLLNGDTLAAEGVLDFAKPTDIKSSIVNVEFDTINGIMTLTSIDGSEQKIEGFATNENTDFSVATDHTLCGNGLRYAPLSVAPSARTAHYKAVKRIIDTTNDQALPSCGNIRGDRYITVEDISDYGYLYDYKSVRKIASELMKSGWRIPTKEDWDDMLNAIEPCDCDKTHDKSDTNRFLGRWAGKLLKSRTMWRGCGCGDSCGSCTCDGCNKHCGCDNDCECGSNTCFNYDDDACDSTSECKKDCKCEDNCCDEHRGLDAYGFRVTPAGYTDDGCNYCFFHERASFWTASTNEGNTKAFIKRFQNNKDGVYQDFIPTGYHMSLRLVKTYDGKNSFDTESILGMDYPTLLMPSQKYGNMIWMAANLACGNPAFSPLLPNDGQSITYTRHYFINEWDGFRWVRNEMRQGDSATVENSPKNKKMIEWRVVGDELVSVNDMVYRDVMKDISEVIEDTKEHLEKRIDKVEENLAIESGKRATEDERLQGEIDELVEKTDKTNADLKTVNDNLVTAINEINNNVKTSIDTINEYVTTSINTINGAIATEVQERKDADQALDEKIEAETEERKAVDEEIKGTILTSDGTEFDKEKGILTLKSKDGTNDVKVQFSFNFGEFGYRK